jgi:glutaredoxin 3
MRYFLSLIFLCQTFVLPAAAEEKHQTYTVMLYYSSRCPYSKKVLSYLDAHGMKIPMKNVLFEAGAKEELKQYGYMVVPCLVVNGQAIYDSNDIIDWLSQHEQYFSKTAS